MSLVVQPVRMHQHTCAVRVPTPSLPTFRGSERLEALLEIWLLGTTCSGGLSNHELPLGK